MNEARSDLRSPIVLGLGVDCGITVDFARGSLDNATLKPLSEAKHVDRAVDGRLGRLHRIVLVVNWRGGTSQIVDFIGLDVQRKGHIVAQKIEARISDALNFALYR